MGKYPENIETRPLTDLEKWEVELDKRQDRICPNSNRIGIRHLWWPTTAPIICTWLSSKSVIVGMGVACQWSSWHQEMKRNMNCYFGPLKIKLLVDFRVQGLTPKIWHDEMANGPSFRDQWGWNLIETEHGWKNLNEYKLNDGPMIHEAWNPKSNYLLNRPRLAQDENRYPRQHHAQNYSPRSIVGQDKASEQPELPEFPLEESREWLEESFE